LRWIGVGLDYTGRLISGFFLGMLASLMMVLVIGIPLLIAAAVVIWSYHVVLG